MWKHYCKAEKAWISVGNGQSHGVGFRLEGIGWKLMFITETL